MYLGYWLYKNHYMLFIKPLKNQLLLLTKQSSQMNQFLLYEHNFNELPESQENVLWHEPL